MPDDVASKQTTAHDTIRRWIEDRNGRAARVRGSGDGGDPGVLRVYEFLYPERTKEGEVCRFSKFVERARPSVSGARRG
jgi:hypothetical protein